MRKILLTAVGLSLALITSALAQKALTLEECINLALKNNWTYRNAQWLNKSAGNDLWSAWGRFLPRADINFSNSSAGIGPTSPFYDNDGVFRPGSLALEYKSYAVGVSFSQVIFDGGANIFNLSSKMSAKSSSDYNLLFNKQNLIFEVKTAYFNVLKANMLLEVQREVAKRSEQQLKIAQSRYELGSASKSDFLKAKVQFGNDQLALLKAENQVQVARASLNAVMGQNVDQAFEVSEELVETPLSLTYEECLNLAYKNHPFIRQSESDVDAATSDMRAARAGYLPTVSIGGRRNWNASAIKDVTLNNIRLKDYRWDIGLAISFNLFEGFQTQNAYLNSRNQMKMAKEKLELAKSDVALEVKQAYLATDENRKSISVTEQNVQAAEEDLNLVQERYRLGAASILELLDAQVSFQTAKSDRIQALFDYNLAVARLERAMGK